MLLRIKLDIRSINKINVFSKKIRTAKYSEKTAKKYLHDKQWPAMLLIWPVKSLYFNLIDHFWSIIDAEARKNKTKNSNHGELIEALKKNLERHRHNLTFLILFTTC